MHKLVQCMPTIVKPLFCLLLLAISLLSRAQPGFDSDAEFAPNDPGICMLCHSSSSPVAADGILQSVHGMVGSPDSPFTPGQSACQSCHGPSATHLGLSQDGSRPLPAIVFGRHRPAAQQDAMCLGCHEQDAGHEWLGSPHEFAELSCSGCHKVHDAVDPSLTFEGKTSLCVNCHPRQQAETLFASSHPIRSGQMTCADCHAPHGGSGPAALLQPTLNDQCFQCHAEKRGPFLWEHAPVSEDCSNCHKSHGSNHRNLLQARTPFLCQQCHLAPFHPSNAESGVGIPPRGASTNLVGRDCSNCHTQIHGSNHPSGAGLTR